MRQRRPLYPFIADVEPNNLPQSESGSEWWSWRDLPSNSGITRASRKTTLTRVSNFLSFVMRRVRRVASSLRLSAQKPPGSVIAITCFQTGVSWHFSSFNDVVLKIELWVPVLHGHRVFCVNLRLRVRWVSHLTPALTWTIFSLPRNTPSSP